VRLTEYKTPPYVVFSTPLLPRPSYAQISSSAPCFRTPSVCVCLWMWVTKSHVNSKQQKKLYFSIH